MSDLGTLLDRCSRTFALSIPLLPDGLGREVAVSYLLFRIADTIEDEPGWGANDRLAALESMRRSVRLGCIHPASDWLVPPIAPLEHAGYAELLAHADTVTAAAESLDRGSASIIFSHLGRTIDGMIEFLGRPPDSLDALRSYCYAVAGIVGEMCSELFVRSCPSLEPAREELLELAPAFGEGLQLVNILRDRATDKQASRVFVPANVSTSALLDLACSDLSRAERYVELLRSRGAPDGIVEFNDLNTRLAIETVSLLARRGSGVKISRDGVREIVAAVLTRSADS